MRPEQSTPPIGPLGLLAFLCEIAMFVLLAIAGHRLGGITLAIALPILAIAIWSVWMAPTSKRRLRNPTRLATQTALFICTAALCAFASLLWAGTVFAAVAIGAFAGRRKIDP